jgi:hypothetical protein
MKCSGCGYLRKDSDSAPEWQCPNCKIAYVKNECSLLWMSVLPLQQEIPSDINVAYIIFSGDTLYYFNRFNKSPLSDAVSLDESERKAVLTILAQLKCSITVADKLQLLTNSLTQEQKNVFKQIMDKQTRTFQKKSSAWSGWSWKGNQKKKAQENPDLKEEPAVASSFSTFEDNYLNRNLKSILFLVNLLFIMSWIFYMSHLDSRLLKNNKKQYEVSKHTEVTTPHHVNTINLAGIDLNKISNYTDALSILASDCKIHVQVYRTKDENCKKAIKLLIEIEPEFKKLDNELKNKDLNELNYTDKNTVNTIYYNLNQTLKDLGTVDLLLK